MYSVLPFIDENANHEPISIFALFDGHGGQRVAQQISKRLPEIFLKAYHRSTDVTSSLDYAFLAADQEIISSVSRGNIQDRSDHAISTGGELGAIAIQRRLSNRGSATFSKAKSMTRKEVVLNTPSNGAAFRRSKSRAEEQISSLAVKSDRSCGTTATVVVVVGDKVHIAHVGDSRAVLSSCGGVSKRLFEDHRPSRRDELERIEKAGGLVLEVSGSFRVNGVLAVSRAIGDVGLKELVIAKPEVQSLELTGWEEFIILASDGLWDFVGDGESVQLVHEELMREARIEGCEEKAAKLLVQLAWDRGSNDDVSVIVINLAKYGELRKECDVVGDDGEVVEHIIEEVDVQGLSVSGNGEVVSVEEVVTPVGNVVETSRFRSRLGRW